MKLIKSSAPYVFICIIVSFFIFQHIFSDKNDVLNDIDSDYYVEQERNEQKVINWPDKEEIMIKMIDSFKYVQSIEGVYEIYDKKLDHKWSVSYSYDKEKQLSRIGYLSSNNEIEEAKLNFISDEKYIIINEVEKTFKKYVNPHEDVNIEYETLSAQQRLHIGHPIKSVILSYALNSSVPSYIQDYEHWDYTKEKFIGFPSYKIFGNIPSNVSNALEGRFEAWIHEKNGVLLEFNVYDEHDEIKYYYKTKEISIDKGINLELFKFDSTDYTEIK